MKEVKLLLLGKEDWNKKYNIPEYLQIDYYEELIEPIKGLMDLVIIDKQIISSKERMLLHQCTKSYCLFVTENVKLQGNAKTLYDCKQGAQLYSGDVQFFFDNEAMNYYPGPYGEKFNPQSLTVNQMFKGTVTYLGSQNLELEGDFGEDFRQIVYWKHNIPLYADQCIDLFFEYQKSDSVEIKLRVVQFYEGSVGEIQQMWEFDEEQLKEPVQIDNKMKYGAVFVSVLAKGKGKLNIISLHDRYSRRNHGHFLPGGERYVTSKGEEFFCYFDKGDMKPPLAIYFSGYRTQEGFEGYFMMRSLGCPFLLVTDPRLEGGAFYLGDEEYENLLLNTIKKYMKELGVDSSQIILSGSSMGTFGALYYGCKLKPHALILGKPLTNMGNVARNERIVRTSGFATSLDVLLKNYGAIDEEAIQKLNNRFWDRFEKSSWSNTKFIISYLYEDDYDPDGYPDILSHLKDSGVQVYGKGIHGRHTDNTDLVIAWFKSQYIKILKEDFKRKI